MSSVIFAGVGSRWPVTASAVSTTTTISNLPYTTPYLATYHTGSTTTMPTNQQIKSAIDMLSTVDESQLNQMEAEFSLIYHRFSGVYERHLNKQIARDNAVDWLKATKVPCCPICNENDKVSIVCPVNDEREYFGSYIGDKVVNFSADSCDFSPIDKELIEFLESNAPHLAHLIRDHLFCERCRKAFDDAGFVKEFWNLDTPIETVVNWVKAGRPGLRHPPEPPRDLEYDRNGEAVYHLEDEEIPF